MSEAVSRRQSSDHSAAHTEEWRSSVGRPGPQHLAGKCSDVTVDMGLEVIAIGKVDYWCRIAEAVDQSVPVRIEDPEGFYLW